MSTRGPALLGGGSARYRRAGTVLLPWLEQAHAALADPLSVSALEELAAQ